MQRSEYGILVIQKVLETIDEVLSGSHSKDVKWVRDIIADNKYEILREAEEHGKKSKKKKQDSR